MKKDKYQVLEDIIQTKSNEAFKILPQDGILPKDAISKLLDINEAETHLNYEATLDYLLIYPQLQNLAPYIFADSNEINELLNSYMVFENIHYVILKKELFYAIMDHCKVTDPYEKLYYLMNIIPDEKYQNDESLDNFLANYPDTILRLEESKNHTLDKKLVYELTQIFDKDFKNISQDERINILKIVLKYHYDYMDKNVSPKIEDEEFNPNNCVRRVTEIIKDNQKPDQKKYGRS